MNKEVKSDLKELKHHKQEKLCASRPAYRQGRKLTAVKVYTLASESQHLFIYGVPKINLRSELKLLCSKYGQVDSIRVVTDHKTEIFTECYQVQYNRIQSARIAKRLLDTRSFYGGILHVCYAPEYESLNETRMKFKQRQKEVLRRLQNEVPRILASEYEDEKIVSRKRKTYQKLALSPEEEDPAVSWMLPSTSKDEFPPDKVKKKDHCSTELGMLGTLQNSAPYNLNRITGGLDFYKHQ